MARVQVILQGRPRSSFHDTENYPVILKFEDDKRYRTAEWVIPSYPGHIRGTALSEIRVEAGNLSVWVDGPAGFQSGPHKANWIRMGYPRGKFCSFLAFGADPTKLGGVSVVVIEGSLVVDPVSVGGAAEVLEVVSSPEEASSAEAPEQSN